MLESVGDTILALMFIGLILLSITLAGAGFLIAKIWLEEMFKRYHEHQIPDGEIGLHHFKLSNDTKIFTVVNLLICFTTVVLFLIIWGWVVDASHEMDRRTALASIEEEKKVLMYQLKLYREAADWTIGGKQKLTRYLTDQVPKKETLYIVGGLNALVADHGALKGVQSDHIVQEGSEECVQEVSQARTNYRENTSGFQTTWSERGL